MAAGTTGITGIGGDTGRAHQEKGATAPFSMPKSRKEPNIESIRAQVSDLVTGVFDAPRLR
jgi:hypothetical protein